MSFQIQTGTPFFSPEPEIIEVISRDGLSEGFLLGWMSTKLRGGQGGWEWSLGSLLVLTFYKAILYLDTNSSRGFVQALRKELSYRLGYVHTYMFLSLFSLSFEHQSEELYMICKLVFLLSLALNQTIRLGRHSSDGPMRVTEFLLHWPP